MWKKKHLPIYLQVAMILTELFCHFTLWKLVSLDIVITIFYIKSNQQQHTFCPTLFHAEVFSSRNDREYY